MGLRDQSLPKAEMRRLLLQCLKSLVPACVGVRIKWDWLGKRKRFGSQIRAGAYLVSLKLGAWDDNGVLPVLALTGCSGSSPSSPYMLWLPYAGLLQRSGTFSPAATHDGTLVVHHRLTEEDLVTDQAGTQLPMDPGRRRARPRNSPAWR